MIFKAKKYRLLSIVIILSNAYNIWCRYDGRYTIDRLLKAAQENMNEDVTTQLQYLKNNVLSKCYQLSQSWVPNTIIKKTLSQKYNYQLSNQEFENLRVSCKNLIVFNERLTDNETMKIVSLLHKERDNQTMFFKSIDKGVEAKLSNLPKVSNEERKKQKSLLESLTLFEEIEKDSLFSECSNYFEKKNKGEDIENKKCLFALFDTFVNKVAGYKTRKQSVS